MRAATIQVARLHRPQAPDSNERVLMVLVLKEVIKEYLPRTESKSRQKAREREAARRWIFEDSKHSMEYVFGFHFICSYIGLDPEVTRDAIKKMEGGDARKRLYVVGPGRKPNPRR